MKHKVIVTGILKKNGEMAYFGAILDHTELISPHDSLDGGFTEIHEEKAETPVKKPSRADAEKVASDKIAAEKAEADPKAEEAADKEAPDQKIADDTAKEETDKYVAGNTSDGKSAADLLAGAKGK